ncbi:hypothetical protein ACQY0O_004457 [Thecaphora frezii]
MNLDPAAAASPHRPRDLGYTFTSPPPSPGSSSSSSEEGEWQPFILDTEPTAVDDFDPDQSIEANDYRFYREFRDLRSSYRGPLGILALGDSQRDSSDLEQDAARPPPRNERLCFNCREPGHRLSSCPHPRDSATIRQSRDEFNAEKEEKIANGGGEGGAGEMHGRLHEHLSAVGQQLEWMQTVIPGKPSNELLHALGLVGTDNGASDGPPSTSPGQGGGGARHALRPPYLYQMLVWGYPPGWIAERDPRDSIREHLLQDQQWRDAEEITGFDVEPLPRCSREQEAEASQKPADPHKNGSSEEQLNHEPIKAANSHSADADPTGPGADRALTTRRWVDFETDLFDSMTLQPFDVHFRRPLPPPGAERAPTLTQESSDGAPCSGSHEDVKKAPTVEEARKALWESLIGKPKSAPKELPASGGLPPDSRYHPYAYPGNRARARQRWREADPARSAPGWWVSERGEETDAWMGLAPPPPPSALPPPPPESPPPPPPPEEPILPPPSPGPPPLLPETARTGPQDDDNGYVDMQMSDEEE